MSDLIPPEDIAEIRQAMTDIADTFAFPIEIVPTTYEEGAFSSDPNIAPTFATGTVTYGTPVDGDTITVGGTIFTKASAASSTEFSTITELTALIDGLDSVTAEDDGEIITIEAAVTGDDGNDITLEKTGSSLELSGDTLSGGQDYQGISLTAIRDFGSSSETDRYRNSLGPAGSHEFNLYIGWASLEDAGIIDDENKILLDHNDLVLMEGEYYEILAFGGVADLTKKPAFMQLTIRRRFENPNGASEP